MLWTAAVRRHRPRPTPEANGDEKTRPLVGTPRGAGDSVKSEHARKVQRDHPDCEHRTDCDPAPACDAATNTDHHAARDEDHAEDRNPGLVPRDPAGNQRADKDDPNKVIDAKDDHGDGDDETADNV